MGTKEPEESVESKGPGLKMKNPGFTRARAFAARYRPGRLVAWLRVRMPRVGTGLGRVTGFLSLPQQNRIQSPPGSRVLL